MGRNASKKLAVVAALSLLATAGALTGADEVEAGKRPPRTHTVTIGTSFYVPSTLTIRRGDRVRWKWEGGFERHNVRVKTGPERFRSPTQTSGRYTRTFRKVGTFRLHCSLHHMKMKLVVKP